MKAWFVLPLALLFACGQADSSATVTTTQSVAPMSAQTPDSFLRHVVLFSFNEDSYPEGAAEVEAAFTALKDKIPQIRDYEWGTNNSPEGLNQGYTHAFFVTFHSEADRDAYLPHPDHLAFVEVLKPHLKDVLVVDYWTKE